jgi:hypothetical protein
MFYSTLEIKPENGKWTIRNYPIVGDRINSSSKPNSYGFYHYPRSIGVKKAFKQLKDLMIEHHEKEIKSLQKSLKKLKALGL